MYAHHSCERKKPNKFLIITENIEEFNEKQEILFVYCYLCNKVYKSNYFYAYCIICNTSYFSNILKKDENPNLLPATWSKYHCEQIINDKMKCIKCKKILYLNLETKMLECQNKNCGFESKPSRILWTCNHCKTEFKSDAIVFNPLELENIKKVVKQTLQTKHKAHPNRMPCCKINTFFTPFYHKKDCPGILYVGDFNNKIIIVCEKCKAINFYDRFIWTCPKCGTRFRDKKSHTRKEPLLLKFDSKKNKNVDNEEKEKEDEEEEEDDVYKEYIRNVVKAGKAIDECYQQ
jgi:ribosomal protein L37AE/L43A